MITKSNYLVVDIETAPVLNYKDFAEEFMPPANYKDTDKIKAYIAEKQSVWLDKLPLSPLTGRICAIGFAMKYKDTEDPLIEVVIDSTGESEYELLTRFWKEYSLINGILVGHNIRNFDMPFIVLRSMKYGITPNCHPPFEDVVDTMDIWNMRRYPKDYISLLNLAKFFDIPPGVKETNKTLFYKLLKNKETVSDAEEYLRNDLILTHKVFNKMNI